MATSKECPKWKLNAAIQKVRAEQKVPFHDAQRLVEDRTGAVVSNVESSSVKKSVVSCAEVQTELKWVEGIAPMAYSTLAPCG